MSSDFAHTTLGRTGPVLHRMGLSATYRPGKRTISKAIDAGINYFFAYGFDTQMVGTLRDVFKGERENLVLSTGAYNLLLGHPNIRRTVEKRLRQFRTEYIDVFLLLGVTKARHFSAPTRDELYRLREEGKIRYMGLSTHNRKFAGQLVQQGAVDVAMIRYNAAHRGAEDEVFPFLGQHNPGLVSYTATRWRSLLRRPSGWPKNGPVPTAAQCYRFVLSHPSVDVCLTAPSSVRQLEENLSALEQGPLTEDEMQFMRAFGDAVHAAKRWRA